MTTPSHKQFGKEMWQACPGCSESSNAGTSKFFIARPMVDSEKKTGKSVEILVWHRYITVPGKELTL